MLREEIEIGDLVVTTGAVRLEGTTKFYVDDGYPAVADYQAVSAIVEAAHRLGYKAHLGITATAPSFYGGQGRPIPQLPIRFPDLAEEMARQRVSNFEMEASALLVLATLAGCRAGVVCTAYAQRVRGVFANDGTTPKRRKGVHRDGLGGASLARRDGRSRKEEWILALAAILVVVSHGILNKGITWSRGERPRPTSSQCAQ